MNTNGQTKKPSHRDISKAIAARRDIKTTKLRYQDAEHRLVQGQSVAEIVKAQRAKWGMAVANNRLYQLRRKVLNRQARQRHRHQPAKGTQAERLLTFLRTEIRDAVLDEVITTLTSMKSK